MNMRRLSSQIVPVALAMAVILVLPASASATISFGTVPGTVKPGQKINVPYTGVCPAGKACGLFEGNEFKHGVANLVIGLPGKNRELEIENGRAIFATRVLHLEGARVRGWYDEHLPTTNAQVALDPKMNGTKWTMLLSWSECSLYADGSPNSWACTVESAQRRLTVAPLIFKDKENAAHIGGMMFRRGKMTAEVTYACNGENAAYRHDIQVQRREKVGRRFVWKTISAFKNVKGGKNRDDNCTASKDLWIPNGNSMFRTRVRVYSPASYSPKIKPVWFTSKARSTSDIFSDS